MENCSINPTENCKALAIVAGLEEKLPLQLKNLMYKFSTKTCSAKENWFGIR